MSWKAESCRHNKMGPAGGCEECWNEQLNLTAIAHTREGLEQAARIIEEGAVEAFKSGSDGYARSLRELRDFIMTEAKERDEKQTEALKEMGLPATSANP